MRKEEALMYRRHIEAAIQSLPDVEASEVPSLHESLHSDGHKVDAGTRINWKGRLMRAAVDLYDNARSTPDAAPALWESIGYRDGFRIIPEHITPGLAFARGERGWWRDTLWESTMDGNVWTPAQAPDLWRACR